MKRRFVISFLAALLILSGCSSADNSSSEGGTSQLENTTAAAPAVAVKTDTTALFSDRDKEIGYDETTSVGITLADSTASCESPDVSINGGTVTIKNEGTYVLSGELSSGQIIIDAEKTDKVQLVLSGVNITCATSATIYVKQADKVFITLATDTKNTLSNSAEYVAIDDNDIDAVIFSKDDLTLNGLGTLTVNAVFGHGIVSKDSLVFTSGNYVIDSASHGIGGKDNVAIADGSFTITSEKDGIHAENKDDTTLGAIYIGGGTYAITAQTDGLDAASTLQIDGGTFSLTTGGGSVNSSTDASGNERESWGNWQDKFAAPTAPNATTAITATNVSAIATMVAVDTTNSVSAKGLKAAGDVLIQGGNFTIDSSDDAVHSNANVTITGGEFAISSGDDGIHADTATVINGGTLNIAKSYEGIEGQSVEIAGGNTEIIASDDGINSAGGNDSSGISGRLGMGSFTANADCYIKISGGKLTVNASGDGLDSNGSLTVSGGDTYVSGAPNSGNGALDYDGEAQITGGIFIATGSSGMAQNFSASSTQATMLVNAKSSQSGAATLQDSDDKTLATYTPPKQYNCVLVSCPEIAVGQTYTLTIGAESHSVTMSEIIYGESGGMGDRPQGGGKNRGEAPTT